MTYRNRIRIERTSQGIVLCDSVFDDNGHVSSEYTVVRNNGKTVGMYYERGAAVTALMNLGGVTEQAGLEA